MVSEQLTISITIDELAKELVSLEKGDQYVEYLWKDYIDKATKLMMNLQKYDKDKR